MHSTARDAFNIKIILRDIENLVFVKKKKIFIYFFKSCIISIPPTKLESQTELYI